MRVFTSSVGFIIGAYHFLLSLGEFMRPYLWWKKYILYVQLADFILLFLHSFQLFFHDCGAPMVYGYMICIISTFFLMVYVWAFIIMDKKSEPDSKKTI